MGRKISLLHHAGVSLDEFERFEDRPASVSVVSLGPAAARILCINGF